MSNTECDKTWRQLNRKKYNEYITKWRNTERGRASFKASTRKYQKSEKFKKSRRRRYYLAKCRHSVEYKENDGQRLLLCEISGKWVETKKCKGCENIDKPDKQR